MLSDQCRLIEGRRCAESIRPLICSDENAIRAAFHIFKVPVAIIYFLRPQPDPDQPADGFERAVCRLACRPGVYVRAQLRR
jgi:hypothetical protein